jgi:hypothetical protein
MLSAMISRQHISAMLSSTRKTLQHRFAGKWGDTVRAHRLTNVVVLDIDSGVSRPRQAWKAPPIRRCLIPPAVRLHPIQRPGDRHAISPSARGRTWLFYYPSGGDPLPI